MIVAALMVLAALGAVDPPPGPPSGSTRAEPPDTAIPIVVDAPATLEALWERLKAPDFILLRGDRYQALLKSIAAPSTIPKIDPTISRVSVRGTAGVKTAEVVVGFEVNSTDPAPRWVAIRLDGLPLTTVKEGGKLLPARNPAGAGWEVEIPGGGNHAIEVNLTVPVATNGEERRIELAVPLAATTIVDLLVADDAFEASMGSRDPVVPVKLPERRGVRLAASVTPRSRVEVTWRTPLDHSGLLPPLLSAQGEIALDVSPDSIRSRARWTIAAVRGTTRELTFTFDADEEVIDVDLDNRSLATDSSVQGQVRTLTIPLPEPLRQGSPSRSLSMTTRRRIEPDKPAMVHLKGFALRHASLQTGVLAIAQTGAIWTEGVSGRGLVRIDPAGELPDDLRSRPRTILAYRFVEQPFDLRIKVEPAAPRLEARARRTITLFRDVASCEAQFQFRATEGRIFELHFRIPHDVVLEPIVPDETVESANLTAETPASSSSGVLKAGRILSVRLTSRARDRGEFTVRLATRQRWTPGDRTSIDLIEPLNSVSLGGRVAVRRVPGIEVDPERSLTGPGGATGFRPGLAAAVGDWTWPTEPSPALLEPDIAWLDHDGRPAVLPLSVVVRPRSMRGDTELIANISRSGINYRETLKLDVQNGSLSDLTIAVPREADSSWKSEGTEVSNREFLETRKDGARLYRLTFAKAPVRSATLKFVYQTAFDQLLASSPPRSDRFLIIRPLSVIDGGVQLRYAAQPGIELDVEPGDFKMQLSSRTQADAEISDSDRVLRGDNAALLPSYKVSAAPRHPMPGLVIGRSYLRTVVGVTDLRTTAMYRLDVHGPAMTFDLPDDARFIQARIDDQPVGEVERTDQASRFRIPLAIETGATPPTLILEYSLPRRSPQAWTPPSFDASVGQAAYWEIVVAPTSALMGVPPGWADENQWRWDNYVWIRTPSARPHELRAWVTGQAAIDDKSQGELPPRANSHAYLFRTTDGAVPISVMLAPRVLLVGLCSGSVGLAGIALVLLRPGIRFLMIPVVMLLLVMAFAWDPNITLQVIQSGALGVILAMIAAGLQRLVDRKRGGPVRISEATGSVQAPLAPSTASLAMVGSDDSTAIRARAPSSVAPIIISPSSMGGPPRVSLPPDSRRPS
jgi:hypothetical protein